MLGDCFKSMLQAARAYRLRKHYPHSVIYNGVVVENGCELGKHVVLFTGAKVMQSTLGAYTYVQENSSICNAEIGPFCSIAGDVIVGLGAHPTFMVSTSPVFYDKDQPLPRFFTKDRAFKDIFPRTVIGADVWIGQGAMVKAGVRIGVGAVIGSASMVTKDVPPYTIAAGNPCRPIRLRFSEATCQRLLDSRWWDFHESKLIELAPLFSDPETFLASVSHGNE
jgi:acetyltransferase-like isoleucine patch superfamily enzyme